METKTLLERISQDVGMPDTTITVLPNSAPNATAFGDYNYLLITTALIDMLSEEELTFVMAHESSHLLRNNLRTAEGYEPNDIRKTMEYRADEDAAATMKRLGLSVEHGITSLIKLGNYLKGCGMNIAEEDPLCDHPCMINRIENLKRLV